MGLSGLGSLVDKPQNLGNSEVYCIQLNREYGLLNIAKSRCQNLGYTAESGERFR